MLSKSCENVVDFAANSTYETAKRPRHTLFFMKGLKRKYGRQNEVGYKYREGELEGVKSAIIRRLSVERIFLLNWQDFLF